MGEIILIVLGLYLLFQIIMGYRRGFLKSLLKLAAWILTFTIAYYGADYVKQIVLQYVPEIQGNVLSDQIAYIIAFVLTAIVVRMIFSFILHFVDKVNNLPGIGFVNKAAGGVLGLAKGLLVIAFLLFFISMMPMIGLTEEYNQLVSGNETVYYLVQNNPFRIMIQNQINL